MTNAELILQLVDKLLKQKEEIETLKSTKAITVKVNIKLIKKYKIELIKNFNIVFPENAKVQLHFLELLYFLFSTSSNLSFKR